MPVDWTDMVRLAAIVSLFAGATAMALVGHVSEMTIVIGVIVLATMASWFHLELRVANRGRFTCITTTASGPADSGTVCQHRSMTDAPPDREPTR